MIKISAACDLELIRSNPKGHFEITEDIDFGKEEYEFNPIKDFGGVLNGNGKSIRNLKVSGGSYYSGLFGSLSNEHSENKECIIKNLKLENVGIVGGKYVGGLVGIVECPTTIENCQVTGNIKGKDNVGGLIGEAENLTIIKDCRVKGNVMGSDNLGGLVGFYSYNFLRKDKSKFLIRNCKFDGNVNGLYGEYIGGLIGKFFNKGILESSVSGYIIGKKNVGGLVGCFSGLLPKSFIDCKFDGILEGENQVGILSGFCNSRGEVVNYQSNLKIKCDISPPSLLFGCIAERFSADSVIFEVSNCKININITDYNITGYNDDDDD